MGWSTAVLRATWAAALSGLCSCAIQASDEATNSNEAAVNDNGELMPHGKAVIKGNKPGGGGGYTPPAMEYHGGPLILGTSNVYYIWYGNWAGNTASAILTDFANGIGGSPWFNINTTYYDGSNTAVTNAVHYAGSTTDNYSLGAALSNTDIYTIVQNALSAGSLPADENGVYFVLTSADVTEGPGFCTSWCGWHTYGTMKAPGGKGNKGGTVAIKYAFIGNPDQCPNACAAQTKSPNSNAGADGMASVIAHELSESVTDPEINAWYDKYGQENADKCAWTFGTTFCATPAAPSKGGGGSCALANVTLGSRNYLIQQNWVNLVTVDHPTGYCALSN